MKQEEEWHKSQYTVAEVGVLQRDKNNALDFWLLGM
jgi:hypothetical protein